MLNKIYGFITVYMIIYSHNSMRRISKMNQHLESSAAEFINSLPAPVAVIDDNRQFVWYNQIFSEKIGLGQDVYGLLMAFVNIFALLYLINETETE